MVWNLVLDDLSPVLPLLRYQSLNRKFTGTSHSKATNIYFFTGLSVGGFALDLSITSHTLLASVANLVYWGAFTAGLSGFFEKDVPHNREAMLHPSLPPPNTTQSLHNPIINIHYRQHSS